MNTPPSSNVEPLKNEPLATEVKGEVSSTGAKSPKSVTFDEQPVTINANDTENTSLIAGMKDMAINALHSVGLSNTHQHEEKDEHKNGKNTTMLQHVLEIKDAAVSFVTNAVHHTQNEVEKDETASKITDDVKASSESVTAKTSQAVEEVSTKAQTELKKGQTQMQSALSNDTKQTIKDSIGSTKKAFTDGITTAQGEIEGGIDLTRGGEAFSKMSDVLATKDQHTPTQKHNENTPLGHESGQVKRTPIDAAIEKIETYPSKDDLHNSPIPQKKEEDLNKKDQVAKPVDSSNDTTVHTKIKSSHTVPEMFDAGARSYYERTGSEFPDTNA